jgi:alpha-mannosidase
MSEKPIVHLICTAHLDPIYKWPWEEGAREAVSTFRTAADLLDEFPEFVFNHSESLLYEWVEEYDPQLFERIHNLVQSGRWNISGGWYLQPDLNLPGGETLVRCIVEGRRYFQEKFDIRPSVAYNFDSFGHSNGLPQLLCQSGFEMYIHGRPFASQLDLPAPLYRWKGADNSSILTLRPAEVWYRTPHNVFSEDVLWAIDQARIGIRIAQDTGQDSVVLWGLGDHGGGPTREDLKQLRTIIEELKDSDVVVQHSTPEAYYKRVQEYADTAPEFEGEIQRVFAGCYTSIAPIKRKMRQVEAALASAERWASIAWWRYDISYPADDLRNAWKRLMLTAFHDVLAGAIIENALPGVKDMFGYAHDVARRIIVSRQHALLPKVSPTPDTIPLYVLNPHAQTVKAHVSSNFLRSYSNQIDRGAFSLFDDNNQLIVHQESGGSPVLENSTTQPFISFVASVPAMTVKRYEIRFEEPPTKTIDEIISVEDEEDISVANKWWKASFSKTEGGLVELQDQVSGKNVLKDHVSLQAMADTGHAWGGMVRANFNQPVGKFEPLDSAELGAFVGEDNDHSGSPVRIIHKGPVFVTVECVTKWRLSYSQIRYTFYSELPQLDIDIQLYMHARQKMIKFVLPFDLPDMQVTCETPYGSTKRKADSTEHSYSRWLQLQTRDLSIGLANNGQNAFDVTDDGVLGLSLTRGAVYSAWSNLLPLDPNKSYTFMDQETLTTRFRIIAGADSHHIMGYSIPMALELNQPLEVFFVYNPPTPPENAAEHPIPFLQVEPANIIVGALKKADMENALIVRLFEAAGKSTKARIVLDDSDYKTVFFSPYEIKTWMIKRNGKNIVWHNCNLLEEP